MGKIEQSELMDVNIYKNYARLFYILTIIHSHYHNKAMNNARFERIQAIKDFLLAQFPLETRELDVVELDKLAVYIREIYYRFHSKLIPGEKH